MKIDLHDDLVQDNVGRPLRHSSVGVTGKDPVQVLSVQGGESHRPPLEARHIQHRKDDQSSAQFPRVGLVEYSGGSFDSRILVAVHAASDAERGPVACAIDQHQRKCRHHGVTRVDDQLVIDLLAGATRNTGYAEGLHHASVPRPAGRFKRGLLVKASRPRQPNMSSKTGR